ncbi:hypothetical protein LTR91_017755, partial [Friedmanniomyces endolithicus]
ARDDCPSDREYRGALGFRPDSARRRRTRDVPRDLYGLRSFRRVHELSQSGLEEAVDVVCLWRQRRRFGCCSRYMHFATTGDTPGRDLGAAVCGVGSCCSAGRFGRLGCYERVADRDRSLGTYWRSCYGVGGRVVCEVADKGRRGSNGFQAGCCGKSDGGGFGCSNGV